MLFNSNELIDAEINFLFHLARGVLSGFCDAGSTYLELLKLHLVFELTFTEQGNYNKLVCILVLHVC